MSETQLTGGTAEDRAAILAQHRAYLEANADMDWERLQGIWSGAPDAFFFNLNGHTYRGREHWTGLWKHLKGKITNGIWEPYDLGGTVTGDLAVVWCHRKTYYKWLATEKDAGRQDERSSVSRSTMVFRKEQGTWRVVHVHFSQASELPRPGGV
jgi:ketosteroid isomerase-like protein